MNLIPSDSPEPPRRLISSSLQGLTEGLTGIASSKKTELLLSIGYILQRVRGQRFLETLESEWNRFREKGRIHEDYEQTDQYIDCLSELLDCIDSDSPDRIRFNAMKNVFLNAAFADIENSDSVLPQQYMRICRTLNSTEILILEANFRLASQGHNPTNYGAVDWLREIATTSVLKHKSLVESEEESLVTKCLITRRIHSDRSGVERTEHFRLTDLGFALGKFIQDPVAADG